MRKFTSSSCSRDHIHAMGPPNSTGSSHDCGLQGCRAEVSAHSHELEPSTESLEQTNTCEWCYTSRKRLFEHQSVSVKVADFGAKKNVDRSRKHTLSDKLPILYSPAPKPERMEIQGQTQKWLTTPKISYVRQYAASSFEPMDHGVM